MSIPGFTAEVSASRVKAFYETRLAVTVKSGSDQVVRPCKGCWCTAHADGGVKCYCER